MKNHISGKSSAVICVFSLILLIAPSLNASEAEKDSSFRVYIEAAPTWLFIKRDSNSFKTDLPIGGAFSVKIPNTELFGGTISIGTQSRWFDMRGEAGYFGGEETINVSYGGNNLNISPRFRVMSFVGACGLLLPLDKIDTSVGISAILGGCQSEESVYGIKAKETRATYGAEIFLFMPIYDEEKGKSGKGYAKIIVGYMKIGDFGNAARVSLGLGRKF